MNTWISVALPNVLAGLVLAAIAYGLLSSRRKEQAHQWYSALVTLIAMMTIVGPAVFAVFRSTDAITWTAAVMYPLIASLWPKTRDSQLPSKRNTEVKKENSSREYIMRDGFALGIKDKNVLEDAQVLLRNKEHYRLFIGNSNDTRCDVAIRIDGATVGIFRLGPRSSQTIERPTSVNGLFTFYGFDTPDALMAGVSRDNPESGRIEAEFRPEKVIKQHEARFSTSPLQSRAPASSGGTGISGHSNQNFKAVQALDYDENETVRIVLKLSLLDDTPRPLPR